MSPFQYYDTFYFIFLFLPLSLLELNTTSFMENMADYSGSSFESYESTDSVLKLKQICHFLYND